MLTGVKPPCAMRALGTDCIHQPCCAMANWPGARWKPAWLASTVYTGTPRPTGQLHAAGCHQ